MTRTLKFDAVILLGFKPLGLGTSEPLKQSGSSRYRCFSKYVVLAFFTGNTCVGISCLKSCSLKASNFIKKRSQHRCFPVKFLRADFFMEHLRWLLLTVVRQYCKVSWSVCSLILPFHAFYLNAKLLYKQFLTITRQNNFFFA